MEAVVGNDNAFVSRVDLEDQRKRLLAAIPVNALYRHKKTGRVFYIRDVVFLHSEEGLVPAYKYVETSLRGLLLPFVRTVKEFEEKFEELSDVG